MSNKTTFEEYLREKGELTYTVKGSSMLPWLKEDRDFFTMKAKSGQRFRKYDVVLYRRDPEAYILHRIIKVRKMDYVILGDNCVNKETGIVDEDILGVMTSFVRNGREISADDFGYRLAVRIRHYLYPLRISWRKVKGCVGRRIKRHE